MQWSEPRTLIEGAGQQPYAKYASDGVRTIHMAFTQDHPRKKDDNSVYYARYAEGAFRRADGTIIASVDSLPFAPEDADLVYDASAEGARAWVWDVAFDDAGRPVIAYAVFPSDEDHRYRYARWTGSGWSDTELTAEGAWFPTVGRYLSSYS